MRQPMAGDIDWGEFISLGFTHHIHWVGCLIFVVMMQFSGYLRMYADIILIFIQK